MTEGVPAFFVIDCTFLAVAGGLVLCGQLSFDVSLCLPPIVGFMGTKGRFLDDRWRGVPVPMAGDNVEGWPIGVIDSLTN